MTQDNRDEGQAALFEMAELGTDSTRPGKDVPQDRRNEPRRKAVKRGRGEPGARATVSSPRPGRKTKPDLVQLKNLVADMSPEVRWHFLRVFDRAYHKNLFEAVKVEAFTTQTADRSGRLKEVERPNVLVCSTPRFEDWLRKAQVEARARAGKVTSEDVLSGEVDFETLACWQREGGKDRVRSAREDEG